MVGSRPVPNAPIYDFERNGPQEHNEGPAYLYITLPQLMEETRRVHGEEREVFLDAKPGLYRALMSSEDWEW